jgi:hypothetical protein
MMNSATFVVSEKSDLFASYNFSMADFAQDNFAQGLPLGAKYQQHAFQVGLSRRFWEYFTGRLQYGFSLYDDAGSGHAADFTAHAVFGTVTVRWP